MSTPQPVAFYAPLKSPEHPSPSGDRTMARLLLTALRDAGFSPGLASHLRTHDKAGDAGFQEQARQQSCTEAERLITDYRDLAPAERPRLWFTYHVYYKAPDWLGPRVADALGIPYVVAEGSRAAKRFEGPWARGHEGAEAALDRADLIFTMTAKDRPGLQASRPARQRLVDLPPFIDVSFWKPDLSRKVKSGPPRLLCVAMMREGDKFESYRILALALARMQDLAWSLDIVGDGEARGSVESCFADFGSRVRFHGARDSNALRVFYESADLLVWPAVNEAYGMVLLEAQLFGNAVVAGDYGGVGSVVEHGRTGLLTPPGDVAAFAQGIGNLLADPAALARMGEAAQGFVVGERNLAQAAARLSSALLPLLDEQRP